MDDFEDDYGRIEADNKKVASDMMQLAGTEDSRFSVITAIYVRLNNELRLQQIQDIKREISYGAKSYELLPERYVGNMDSIVKSYIQEINKFMSAYNDEFLNIQNIMQSAEEKQKFFFYKIRELVVMKKVCALSGKPEEEYAPKLNFQIKEYRKQIGIYERIIMRCDKEFEDCKDRRAQDFKELFEVKQETALAVIEKKSFIQKFIEKIMNKFKGYEGFQKNILQKYASKINQLKTETTSSYVTKTKQDTVNFNSDIDTLMGVA